MARVDYYALEEAIRTQLKTTATLADTTILIEEEVMMQPGNVVVIYLDRRDAPADEQVISAGRRTRFNIKFTIACYHSGLDKSVVMEQRDDLLGKVELALMADNTFSNSVDASWIEGGDFENARNQGGTAGFVSVGTIELIAQVSAVQ